MKKKINILWLIIFSVLAAAPAGAALTVNNFEILADQKVIIYCSESPVIYSTKLAPDKKKLNITFPGAALPQGSREAHGKGLVEDVYAGSHEGNLIISVIFRQKSGYTAVPLPYSKALLVSPVNWKELSPAQDKFNEALLAIESGTEEIIADNLKFASDKGHAEAALFLSMHYIKSGDIALAAEQLKLAFERGAALHDKYAALAQLLSIYDINDKAILAREVFKGLTANKSVPELMTAHYSEAALNDSSALANLLAIEISKKPGQVQVTPDKFKNLFADSVANAESSSTATTQQQEASADGFITWLKDLMGPLYPEILYALLALAFIGFALIAAFIRWRNAQLKKLRTTPQKPRPFNQDMDKARKSLNAGKAHAANLYKQNAAKPKPAIAKKYEDNKDSAEKDNPLSPAGKATEKPDTEDLRTEDKENLPVDTEQTETGDEDVKPKPKEDVSSKLVEIAKQIIEEKNIERSRQELEAEAKLRGLTPDQRLSLELKAKKKAKKKEVTRKALNELDDKDIDSGNKAKELGIGQNDLETKKKLNKLKQDADYKEELRKKFGREKND